MAKTSAEWEALRARAVAVKTRVETAGYREGAQYLEHAIAELDARRGALATMSGAEQDQLYSMIDQRIQVWEQKLGSPGATGPTTPGLTPAQIRAAQAAQMRTGHPAALLMPAGESTQVAQGSAAVDTGWFTQKTMGIPNWGLVVGGVAIAGGLFYFFRGR